MYNNYMNYYSPTQSGTNKIFVSGVEEVKQKMLMPGSDYLFLDNDKPIIYQKTVDLNGKYELKQFKIEEIPLESPGQDFVKRSDFEALKAELDALKGGIKNDGQRNE